MRNPAMLSAVHRVLRPACPRTESVTYCAVVPFAAVPSAAPPPADEEIPPRIWLGRSPHADAARLMATSEWMMMFTVRGFVFGLWIAWLAVGENGWPRYAVTLATYTPPPPSASRYPTAAPPIRPRSGSHQRAAIVLQYRPRSTSSSASTSGGGAGLRGVWRVVTGRRLYRRPRTTEPRDRPRATPPAASRARGESGSCRRSCAAGRRGRAGLAGCRDGVPRSARGGRLSRSSTPRSRRRR